MLTSTTTCVEYNVQFQGAHMEGSVHVKPIVKDAATAHIFRENTHLFIVHMYMHISGHYKHYPFV
jgi:hypothetical protein